MMKITVEVHDAQKIRPATSGYYCTILYHGYYDQMPTLMSMSYSKKHDAFNVHDYMDSPDGAIPVDYWFDVPDVANIAPPMVTKMTGPCELCGRWCALERHHVYGASNRKHSEHYGYVVNLCHDCHNEPPNGVHHNAARMLALHQRFQRVFEVDHTRAEFVQIFGKNYLD